MQVSPALLAALLDKYRAIKRLRDARAAGSGIAPRHELLALSRRFPGALRELDALPMSQVQARIHALEVSLATGAAPEWAALQVAYHGTLRAALRIKHLAGRGADVASARAQLVDRYEPAEDEPTSADLDDAALAAILRPPGGRLNPWVFARVGALLGVPTDAVRAALFVCVSAAGPDSPGCA